MNDRIVIAAAGSGKTEMLVREALERIPQRVLVTTYTNRNAQELRDRLCARKGIMPGNVDILTWYEFLLRHAIKPYQCEVVDPCKIRAINFEGIRSRYVKRQNTTRYYFDSRWNIYCDVVSDLACVINARSKSRTILRLESLYDAVFIDEMQDLVGYDLDMIDLLFASRLTVVTVGDPRQFTYATNRSARNKQFRGIGLTDWARLRNSGGTVIVEVHAWSYRCHQTICDFADRLYPEHDKTVSRSTAHTEHDGIFLVHSDDLEQYLERFEPMVLRWDRRSRLARQSGVKAVNIGAVKGCTFDRVVVIPTKPMIDYLKSGEVKHAGGLAKLYVAVTRAKHSVAFVVSSKGFKSPLAEMWSVST